jgi:hypothetical protein
MPQLSNQTKLALALIGVMLFLPVYGEVFLYFGWTKLSIGVTVVMLVALFWSITSVLRRRPG